MFLNYFVFDPCLVLILMYFYIDLFISQLQF